MIENEQDLINAINQNRSNGGMFPGNPLQNVHNRMTAGLGGNQRMSSQDKKIAAVVMADKQLRASVRDLAETLFDLGDKETAQKLLSEHILMLNSIFDEFG